MNIPPRSSASHPFDFEPTFHRVAQTNQWNSAMACIASVVNKPIDEVRLVAAKQSKRPANGRWSVTPKLIPELLDYYDWWAASRYKTANAVSDLPDLALILLSKRPDHFGLFHRQKFEAAKPPVCYLINPALGIPVDRQWRLDVEVILPCQYMSICLMSEYMKDFW
jgi:hypothetical protein